MANNQIVPRKTTRVDLQEFGPVRADIERRNASARLSAAGTQSRTESRLGLSQKVEYASRGFNTLKTVFLVLLVGAIALGGLTGLEYILTTLKWYHWTGIILVLLAIWRRL